MFPSPNSQPCFLRVSPRQFFFFVFIIFCDVHMADVHLASSWSCHTMPVIISKNHSGFLLHLHSLTAGKWLANIWKKKKMACHYFLKTDLVSGSWSVKIVHVLLKFPYTWPNVASRRKIYFPVFSFQAFLGSWSRRKWNCRNECTLLFRLEPLYSSLFLLCLMYAKLTKK